jgi:hypothetical protein
MNIQFIKFLLGLMAASVLSTLLAALPDAAPSYNKSVAIDATVVYNS